MLFSFLSCSKDEKKKSNITTISISFSEKENILPLSSFVDTLLYIPLESNDQSLIGEIDKILSIDSGYIIIDKEITSKIFYFDKKGKFISSIGEKGHANNEYISIEDVTTDGNFIYILDTVGPKFLC